MPASPYKPLAPLTPALSQWERERTMGCAHRIRSICSNSVPRWHDLNESRRLPSRGVSCDDLVPRCLHNNGGSRTKPPGLMPHSEKNSLTEKEEGTAQHSSCYHNPQICSTSLAPVGEARGARRPHSGAREARGARRPHSGAREDEGDGVAGPGVGLGQRRGCERALAH
jgi:hypothetical protein